MNQLQIIASIFSFLFVMFSLWGRFDDNDRFYNKLLKKKNAIVAILIAILYAGIGNSLDFFLFRVNVQSGLYYVPFSFIILLQIINRLCILINDRKFYSIRSQIDMSANSRDFIDLFFTFLLIFLSITAPFTFMNYFINNRFFN